MTRIIHKITALFLAITLVLPAQSFAQVLPYMPPVGQMITPGPTPYDLPYIVGMRFSSDNIFEFTFFLNRGNVPAKEDVLRSEVDKVGKYFLAALTIPEKDLWVNLSPYEQNRIITPELGRTDLGKDLLGEDYVLKQLASSLTFPDSESGKKYWDAINNVGATPRGRPGQAQGPAPTNSFTKIWIIPGTIKMKEASDRVVITEATLKVLTEEDYLAMNKNGVGATPRGRPGQAQGPAPTGNNSSAAMRNIIVPLIEKEVNTGKHFAHLRQVYRAIILAGWFKKKLKDTILNQVYFDQKKTKGAENNDPALKDKIYNEYVKAFNQGVYNVVKREFAGTSTGSPVRGAVGVPGQRGIIIRRQYFSGGVGLDVVSEHEQCDLATREVIAGAIDGQLGGPVAADMGLRQAGGSEAPTPPPVRVSPDAGRAAEIRKCLTAAAAMYEAGDKNYFLEITIALASARWMSPSLEKEQAVSQILDFLGQLAVMRDRSIFGGSQFGFTRFWDKLIPNMPNDELRKMVIDRIREDDVLAYDMVRDWRRFEPGVSGISDGDLTAEAFDAMGITDPAERTQRRDAWQAAKIFFDDLPLEIVLAIIRGHHLPGGIREGAPAGAGGWFDPSAFDGTEDQRKDKLRYIANFAQQDLAHDPEMMERMAQHLGVKNNAANMAIIQKAIVGTVIAVGRWAGYRGYMGRAGQDSVNQAEARRATALAAGVEALKEVRQTVQGRLKVNGVRADKSEDAAKTVVNAIVRVKASGPSVPFGPAEQTALQKALLETLQINVGLDVLRGVCEAASPVIERALRLADVGDRMTGLNAGQMAEKMNAKLRADGGFNFAGTQAKNEVTVTNGGLNLSSKKAMAYLASGKLSGFRLAILALRY